MLISVVLISAILFMMQDLLLSRCFLVFLKLVILSLLRTRSLIPSGNSLFHSICLGILRQNTSILELFSLNLSSTLLDLKYSITALFSLRFAIIPLILVRLIQLNSIFPDHFSRLLLLLILYIYKLHFGWFG